ncbi:MAG: nucleotidyltransferase family protein [Pseudomonadota bacterium]
MKPEVALVLAAGLGTRMRPLTDRIPKALVPVAGQALVDRALDHVGAAGIDRAVVNLHHFADRLADHLAIRPAPPKLALSDERDCLLDTGGGLARAALLLGGGPVIAMNADAVFAGPDPLAPLLATWSRVDADALLLLVRRKATRGYTRPGDFFLAKDGGIPERRGARDTAPFVFTGVQILATAARDEAATIAADTPVFSMNAIWDRLLARGRLAATVWPSGAGCRLADDPGQPHAAWCDVGTPAGIEAAEAALSAWEAACI